MVLDHVKACLLVCLLMVGLVAPLVAQTADEGLSLPESKVGQNAVGLDRWLDAIESSVGALLEDEAQTSARWTTTVLRLYLDNYELLEAWYGPGGAHTTPELSTLVTRGEARFHALMQARDADAQRSEAGQLLRDVAAIRSAAAVAGVERYPGTELRVEFSGETIAAEAARTEEVQTMLRQLRDARVAYGSGDSGAALEAVEELYLQGFEPLEPRLPGALVRDVESLVHLTLRPQLARAADASDVNTTFDALNAALARVDESLADGGSFWFTAVNAFAIIVREGLEAALLIAAMLAYLSGMGAPKSARVQIWVGTAAGLAATVATWVVARTLIPVTGAGRELLEGVTALIAVAVLIYVSNWLFHKTYIEDWKSFLRERVGRAVTTGSALAMAGLAFAAIYREGFETVLFYQALVLDDGTAPVLAGFAPGFVLILLIGAAILKLGVKLPLKRMFALTNGILIWLAFVFLGKGLYNLQEAGLFAPRPIRWLPDHEALRQLLGFYPTAETVTAQMGFVTFIALTWWYYRRRVRATA